MHLPTYALSLLGVTTFLILQASASLKTQLTNDASNFHQIASSPSSNSYQRASRGDLQPVAYHQQFQKRLFYHKHKLMDSTTRKARYSKRDYATTLKLLRAAILSYQRDLATTPSSSIALSQFEQKSPAPAPVYAYPAVAPPPPLAPAPQAPMVAQPVAAPPPPLNPETSPVPDPLTATSTMVELSNGVVEVIPVSADLEEDDVFDPEEDPDDVGPPPFVNGKPVDREE